jgi:hypothetical protein
MFKQNKSPHENVDTHDGFKFTKTMGLCMMIFLTGSFFITELIVGHVTNSNTLGKTFV